jgi:tetratricopeptide (TPR) repeat protein
VLLMRLNKGLIVACLMFGLPAASFGAKFNQDDLFKTVPSQSQSKTVTPTPPSASTLSAAGAFANTVSSIKDADKKAKARKFLPIANAKIAEEPSNAQYYLARAQIYRDLEDYQSSLADVNHAIVISPTSQQSFALRSAIWANLNNEAEALKDIDHALALGPPSADLLESRADDLLLLGRNQEALESCERAIQLNPKSGYAYAIRGAARYRLKDYHGAESDCRKAETLGQTDSVTSNLRHLLNQVRK